jgi:hypothetical protein
MLTPESDESYKHCRKYPTYTTPRIINTLPAPEATEANRPGTVSDPNYRERVQL